MSIGPALPKLKVAMVPAVPCPHGPSTDPEAIMCYLCEGYTVCNSWEEIAMHLEKEHGMGAIQLHGPYLWNPEPALTQEEFDNVMHVLSFRVCKGGCGKILFEVVVGEAVGLPCTHQLNFQAAQVLQRHAASEGLGGSLPGDAGDGGDALAPLGWGDGVEGGSIFQKALGSDELEGFHFQEAIKLSRAHAEDGLVEGPPSMLALLDMDTAGDQGGASGPLALLEGSMSEEDSYDDVAGPPSKRTKTSVSETQQAYLQTHAMQKFGGSMPTKAWFRELLQQGIQENVFTAANTAEGLRSCMRRAVGDFKKFRKNVG